MKRIIALFLSLVLALCLLPAGVLADGETVSCIDRNGQLKTLNAANVTIVTAEDTAWGEFESTHLWYMVTGDVIVSHSITVTGGINLILADGASLTLTEGNSIILNDGSALMIYGQSEGTGKLTVTRGADDTAGICTTADRSCVEINGGIITATGGKQSDRSASGTRGGAGIGGGYGQDGNVIINGGTVTATGASYAAGIGGGGSKSNIAYGAVGGGGTVTINGGTVTATGGFFGAGIGGGYSGEVCTVTVNGGTINARGNGAPGIGGSNNTAGNVKITGGHITASGGGTISNGVTHYNPGIGSGSRCWDDSTITIAPDGSDLKASLGNEEGVTDDSAVYTDGTSTDAANDLAGWRFVTIAPYTAPAPAPIVPLIPQVNVPEYRLPEYIEAEEVREAQPEEVPDEQPGEVLGDMPDVAEGTVDAELN